MTKTTLTTLALAAALTFTSVIAASAQDSSALIDALVRKKILTPQEAEDVRADLIKENATSNAGKLQLSNSVTSLKLYGDLRLRYTYDTQEPQVSGTDHLSQRSRERLRLRLNADFTLTGGFFGGVQLQTSSASDGANQTLGDSTTGAGGFGNYNIYISRAFFGWGNDWLTLVGGKQHNPFYSTDLVWDPDINPDGFVQKIDLLKAFGADNSEPRTKSRFGLSLVAGQFVFSDNNEYNPHSDASRDCWLFTTQLIGTMQVTPKVKVTFAPGYMTYTAGNTADLNNSPTGFMTTKSGTNLLAYSSQRDLSVITAPGDVSFSVCGLKTKVLWDFAYNTQGEERARKILGLTGVGANSAHSSQDNIAWLAGVQVGQNKTAGDWSVLTNFRQTGIAAVDPNLNDSDFANGYVNMQGVKTSIAYSFTDSAVFAVTYYDTWNLRSNLIGGQATGGTKIASMNAVQILQVDLNLKF